MKKLLLLLCAFMASISGAWAQVAAPTTAPNDPNPAPVARKVAVVYSNYFGVGLRDYDKAWGGGPVDGAQWTATEEPVITGTRKVLHVTGTAFTQRLKTSNGNNNVNPVSAGYTKVHVYVYPMSATTVYIYKDGGWSDADKQSKNVSPGVWNLVEFDVPATWTKDYFGVALKNGENLETEFYMDDFYFTNDDSYVDNVQTFGSFELPNYIFSATTGYNINATYKDTEGTDFAGDVTLTWDGSSPVGSIITGNNIVFGAASGEGTYTLKATDGVTEVTKQLYFIGTAPAAPTGDVSVVYDGSTGVWSDQGWGWGGSQSDIIINGKTCRKGEKLGGMQIPNSQNDYITYKKVVIDVWSAQAHSLTAFYEGDGATKNLELVAGWNQLEVPTSIVSNPANVSYLTFQYKNSDPKDGSLVFSNVYYSKEEPADPAIVVTVDGVTTVTGKVTESDISTISASTASKLDLTGVSSWTATSPISSANPNQIIVVGCTYTGTNSNPGTITPNITVANTKNVVAYTAGYYFTLTPIEITDNNEYQPWNGSINTNYGSQGYTITRTVPANKYVSAYFPTTTTNVTVTNGTIYTLDAANSTTSDVKFNKAVSVGGGTPFIVHTTGEATIRAQGSGDLNIGENGGNTGEIEFATSALFKGNLIEKAGTGSEWGLQGSSDASPEFKTIGTGAKIGAFRAYFTGLTSAGARAFFIDDNGTTSIKKIEDILNHEDVYYNLNGQRVQNPTKGIYILNGKKVIIK